LRSALEDQGLAAAILSRPQHLFYFLGAMPGNSPAFLVVTPKRLLGVAPAALPGYETITYTDYDIQHGWSVYAAATTALERALAALGPRGRPVWAELTHLSAAFLSVLVRHTDQAHDIADLLWRLRRIKDRDEIAQIETNVARNDRLFALLQETIRPEVTDFELWAVLVRALSEMAGSPVSLEADLGVGQATDSPDARPTGNRVKAGDHVLVDVYSATDGCYADTTRVFTVGQPDARQQEVHGVLEAALQAGAEQLRPGMEARAVDAAVRRIIDTAGYAKNFSHHSGHAYGIFQQERPYLIPAEPMPLEEGMIITLEPGIYLPGWGGMRLESNFVVTSDGSRRLDHFPATLVVCL
jgi:Xaa-Pro aminopeptidase